MKSSKKPQEASSDIGNSNDNPLLEPIVHVWLAGLGAVSKAQTEGGKLLDELIEEGARVQGRKRDTGKKSAVRGTLDDLQALVQRTIHELPPFRVLEEVLALRERIDVMNANIEKLTLECRTPRIARVAKKARQKS